MLLKCPALISRTACHCTHLCLLLRVNPWQDKTYRSGPVRGFLDGLRGDLRL